MVGTPGDAQRIYQLIIDAGGSKAGADMFKRAADQISESAAKAVAAGKPLNDNVAAAEKAYARLVTRIDPVTTAQVRMAREIEVVQRAFAAQKITVEQAATNLQQITTKYETVIERAKRFGQGLGGATTAGRGFGTAIQQAGFQVGDFAVQVASGSGVLRPLIQQGTQLISMFGPWGAVIGAAGAVVGALVTSFLDLESATKKAQAAEEAHNKALEKSRDLYKGIRGDVEQTTQLRTAELRTIVEQAEAEYRNAQAKLAATPAMTRGAGRVSATANPDYKAAQAEVARTLSYVQQQRAILDAALDDYDARVQQSFAAKPAGVTAAATTTSKAITTTTKAVTEYTKAAEDLDSKLNGLLSTMNLMAPGEAQIELAFEQGKISAEEYRKALETIDSVDQVQKSDPAKRINSAAAATKEAADATMNWSSAISTFGNAFTSAMDLASGSGSKLSGTIRGIAGDVMQLLDVGFQLFNMFSGGGSGGGFGGGGSFLSGIGSYLFGAPKNSGGFRMTGAGPGASANTSGLFSNGGWNPLKGITSWAQGLFGFDRGGIMGPNGPIPLRKYDAGGVATSPQLAMFGEGRKPEAYVPLNDGRTIPVSIQGGGRAANSNDGQWGGNVIHYAPTATFNVTGGIDKSTEMAMHRVAAAYSKASVEGFKASINSGGGDAVLVGRRRK